MPTNDNKLNITSRTTNYITKVLIYSSTIVITSGKIAPFEKQMIPTHAHVTNIFMYV